MDTPPESTAAPADDAGYLPPDRRAGAATLRAWVARVEGVRYAAAWCPACGRWHWHGGWPEDCHGAAAHREAHCAVSDANRRTGYIVGVEGDAPPALRRDMLRRRGRKVGPEALGF